MARADSFGRRLSRVDSFSSFRKLCRPISLPGALAELGAAHPKALGPRRHLYLAHEALLDLWIKRGEKLRSRHWVLDPVSRPRVAWRWAGVWLLLLHTLLLAPAAWVRYRCDQKTPLGLSWDPACEERERLCPSLLDWSRLLLDSAHAPPPRQPQRYDRQYGCRREAVAEAVGASVRLFSAADFVLRLAVPSATPASSTGLLHRFAPKALLALDGLLTADVAALVPLLAPPLRHALLLAPSPPPEADAGRSKGRRLRGTVDRARRRAGAVTAATQRKVGRMRAVRTLAAYRRVKQLPPPPGPWAQWLLEEALLKPLIGPGLRNAVRALPTIGDVLAEAELAEAFCRSFLTSARRARVQSVSARGAPETRPGLRARRLRGLA